MVKRLLSGKHLSRAFNVHYCRTNWPHVIIFVCSLFVKSRALGRDLRVQSFWIRASAYASYYLRRKIKNFVLYQTYIGIRIHIFFLWWFYSCAFLCYLVRLCIYTRGRALRPRPVKTAVAVRHFRTDTAV